jgi:hypothetical protein
MPAAGAPSFGGDGGGDVDPPDGGVSPDDAGSTLIGCDYSGTWASYVSQPVEWPATPLVLLRGSGKVQQWNLVYQQQDGLNVATRAKVCSIFLPDLEGDLFAAYYKFGIRFPDALFDDGTIVDSEFVLRGSVTAAGDIAFETETFASVGGVWLADPIGGAWPSIDGLLGSASSSSSRSVDDDQDGRVGITVIPATGQGYSLPPANLALQLADRVYIAERTVSRLYGTLTSCDEVHGSVEIVSVNGKPGIDSRVIGCRKDDGNECTREEAGFVDGIRPQFAPTGPGTLTVVRMPDGATCADVRARFPRQ